MNKLFPAWLLFGILVLASACTDILETDISEEEVTILLPLDNSTSEQSVQTFWWEELEGADSYLLTVVSPSFDSIERRVLQATISGTSTSYDTSLLSGTYQWTLQGQNGGFKSKEKIYTLFVKSDTSNDLSIKTVLLTKPASDLSIKDGAIDFRWDEMSNADNYTLQVASPDFSDNGNIQINQLLQDNNYSTTLEEGAYRWRVRGENASSVSPFSERGFTVDATAPNAPQLVSPLNNAIVTLPTTLTWTPDTESSADTLYVYSDSLQTTTVLKLGTTATQYSFDDNTFPFYFWRVRSVDAAGNVGAYSGFRKFTAQ